MNLLIDNDMLNEILENRKKQVSVNKELYPSKLLEMSPYFESRCVSLKQYIIRPDKSGIIAEFKRSSPSKGIINQYADVMETTIGYMQAGASALSVLTEPLYFNGKDEDLKIARNVNYCPILRKDFIFDEYQILESKSIGADAVLLISALLDKKNISKLYMLARSLGMEVLFEIHETGDLEKLPDSDIIIGVNNRNLATMEVDPATSFKIADFLPGSQILVSESGLSQPEDIIHLKEAGFSGFLIGESLMKSPQPWTALKYLIADLKRIGR